MKKNITIAFGSVPKDGGTFTFYRTIRPKLLEYGIDIRCVSVGKAEADLIDEAFVDDGCILVAETEKNVKRQAQAFTEWCQQEKIDIVFAINSIAILSALPHLPEQIRVMSRGANSFDHGYRITISCYDRLTWIIATTPRMKSDLVHNYGVEESKIRLIPNGVRKDAFKKRDLTPRTEEKPLRLGFLGRLEHNQKGVLYLPKIIEHLNRNGVDFTFQIAGKGVHGKALERELRPFILDGRVTFKGPISPKEVVDFLHNIDVFIFPSRFEGCPNALLEAIMAGCVTVAWKLEGIIDFILKSGVTGFVSPMADCEFFASRIAELYENRKRLKAMSFAAAHDARRRFSQERMATDYARLIEDVMEKPPPPWTPLPWSAFRPDPAFSKSNIWNQILPKSFKRTMKNYLFYVGLSNRYYD